MSYARLLPQMLEEQYPLVQSQTNCPTEIQALEYAESKLSICSELLKAQIRRNHLPIKLAVDVSAGVAIGVSAWHMTKSIMAYNAGYKFLTEKLVPFANADAINCDDLFYINLEMNHFVSSGSGDVCDSFYRASQFGQTCLVKALEHLHFYIADQTRTGHDLCSDPIDVILEGPGMWRGYLPVITILGLSIPLIILTSDLVFNCSPRLMRCLVNQGMSEDKSETLMLYSRLYDVKFSKRDSLSEIKSNFDDKIIKVKEALAIARTAHDSRLKIYSNKLLTAGAQPASQTMFAVQRVDVPDAQPEQKRDERALGL
jgi:hypothetical protein